MDLDALARRIPAGLRHNRLVRRIVLPIAVRLSARLERNAQRNEPETLTLVVELDPDTLLRVERGGGDRR